MRRLFALAVLLAFAGCHSTPRDPRTVVFLIESSPANLDPRIGTDAQSEHIDELLFDGLVARDASFHFTPALAESWEQPDPLTLIFHLRQGVRFDDGRVLTARDVVWTVNSIRSGQVISPKAAAYASVDTVEAKDARTVVFHLKHADNFLLTNLIDRRLRHCSRGQRTRVLAPSGGHGPLSLCEPADRSECSDRAESAELGRRAEDTSESALPWCRTRSPNRWSWKKARATWRSIPCRWTHWRCWPRGRIWLSKTRPERRFNTSPSICATLCFKDVRVRQAIACAIDRKLIIQTLLRGHAQPAESLLPASHWAWTGDVARYNYDPARAERLLDEAGYHAGANGVRFHLTMKTSTDEGTRLLAAVLQQQLAKVGIALELRSYEYATFYSDVTRGAFQMYSLQAGSAATSSRTSSAMSIRPRSFLRKAPTAATTRIRDSMRCSTMRPKAQTPPAVAPITCKRSRFLRAICRPSISGTGIRW